jgi:hypothetical protein
LRHGLGWSIGSNMPIFALLIARRPVACHALRPPGNMPAVVAVTRSRLKNDALSLPPLLGGEGNRRKAAAGEGERHGEIHFLDSL